MTGIRFVRIVLTLCMMAILCSAAGAAGMSVIAETHETSGVDAPVCTAPCECMSETAAIQRWGADGWDRCSKTVCGQSANANVQYYCLHQAGSSVAAGTRQPAQAPTVSTPVTAGATQKSPVTATTLLTAIGIALLAVRSIRRE
jgi:hypothetical protein